MKPEWCPQEIWDVSDQLIGCDDDAPPSQQDIARALLDAHQRGRREGMEEAAKMARAHDDEPIGALGIARAIRAKAREVSQ